MLRVLIATLGFVAWAFGAAGVPSAAFAEKRVALVIGNSAYQHAPQLANPKNDATDMVTALKKVGFVVIEGFDLDKAAFDRKVRDFSATLKGSEAGLFFYAGHGLQVGGQNYLVPIDAKAETEDALDWEMLRVDVVHRAMERSTSTNILFLDACRDNPLARNLARAMGTRSTQVGRGLATIESGVGTLISFSTQPGNVALDGSGRNSPFAGALVKQLSSSTDDLSAMLIAVRKDVMTETERRQVPWEHSALTGRFYFKPTPQTAEPAKAAPARVSEAAEAWGAAERTTNIAVLEAFIARFNETFFADLARARIGELQKQTSKPPEISASSHIDTPMKPVATLSARQTGPTFRDCPKCPEMAVVPAGDFMMGSPRSEEGRSEEEGPQRRVIIAKPFAAGKFEVTFAEWEACVAGGGCASNKNPGDEGWGRGLRPVINVTWDDATQYVTWLTKTTGKAYRLLTEAEWEYAARGLTNAWELHTPFSTGATISSDQANYNGNYIYGNGKKGVHREKTVEVGSFPPNAFGLHDMHGNVYEWVQDCYNNSHSSAPKGSEVTPAYCSLRVLRSGSWNYIPMYLRSAMRERRGYGFSRNDVGFRVARALAQ